MALRPADAGRRTFRALRHRNFRLFFYGQLISLIGTWLQSVAQQWLVYRLTGSSVLLGFVGFAGQVPVFLFSPLGGAVADRVDRRRVLVATQSAMMLLALGLGGLTLAGLVTVQWVFGFAIALGIVNGFDVPTRQSFIVEMVEREDFPNAIALNSSAVNGARIVGPAIAGLLVASVGEGWCFVLNGLSFLAVIGGLIAMQMTRLSRASRSPATRAMIEGFSYVWKQRPIRALLALVACTSLLCVPYAVLMPIFADRWLHAGARGLGLLMAAGGFGALVAALLLALRGSARGLGRWVAAAAAGFGGSLILFAGACALGNFALAMCTMPLIGFCMVLEMSAGNTVLQTLAPDAMRGRIMSAWSMTFFGTAPFGALFYGFAAGRLGAPLAVAVGGALAIVAAMIFGMKLPGLRSDARALVAANEMPAGLPGVTERRAVRA